ncbi:hypothetical protein BHE74_00057900 [Ensete ventricosum]|nr:hypothetical protein BHE74_00057900 [Ensete ventricosum]
MHVEIGTRGEDGFLKGNVVRLMFSNRRKGIIRIDSALRRRTRRSFVAAYIPEQHHRLLRRPRAGGIHCTARFLIRHAYRSSASKDRPFWVSICVSPRTFSYSPRVQLLSPSIFPGSILVVGEVRPSSVRAFSTSFRSYVVCCANGNPSTVVLPGSSRDLESHERKVVRLGLPSKGRMADETLSLLKLVALSILFLEELNYRFIFKMQNLEVCYSYELATLLSWPPNLASFKVLRFDLYRPIRVIPIGTTGYRYVDRRYRAVSCVSPHGNKAMHHLPTRGRGVVLP